MRLPTTFKGFKNVDHPHGDGTHGTAAGDPLHRLGAGKKYGEHLPKPERTPADEGITAARHDHAVQAGKSKDAHRMAPAGSNIHNDYDKLNVSKLNVDHPHGDGTHGTAAGDPLHRLGAGKGYGE